MSFCCPPRRAHFSSYFSGGLQLRLAIVVVCLVIFSGLPSFSRAEEKATDSANEWAHQRREAAQKLPPAPAPPEVQGVPTWNAIDRFIAARWPAAEGAESAQPTVCDDATFVRRLYLDVAGRIPNEAELDAALTALKTPPATEATTAAEIPPARRQLIEQLLARREDYAAHWVPFWEDALCSNGKHQGGVITKADFRKYILQSFAENKPYDLFAAALLNPNMPGGQAGYIKTESREQSLRSARDTAQVFLGTALKCASCHDHFLNPDWKLVDFYGYANYFSAENLELVRCEEKLGHAVPTRFILGEDSGVDEKAGLPSRLARMTALTVTPANPRFARAFVNRLWRRYLGIALVEPPDDIRTDTPASHPELLDWLAHDFITHDFDIQHVVREILCSRTYQLAYDARLADPFDPSRPEGAVLDSKRFYRSPAARRLTCEQVLDSLHVVTGQGEARRYRDDNSTALTRALGRPSTRNEVRTTRTDEIAVIQSLEFMNGPEFNEPLTKCELPAQWAASSDRKASIARAYRIVLSRTPTDEEAQVAESFFAEGATEEAWRDFLWVLLTSPEFHYVR